MVVGSAINDQAEEVYARKWNHDFIDMPVVKHEKRPAFTSEELTLVLASPRARGWYGVLYALLAGTGLRIGEMRGLEIEHIIDNCTTIQVRQSTFNGRVQRPKTPNAIRDVDLHSDLAAILREFIGDRKTGFLFQTKRGRPVGENNILNRNLNPILEEAGLARKGFHGFRRFRVTWLRKKALPESLLKFWIGHANKDVTDVYDKLREDVEYRKMHAEKVSFGFLLPEQIRAEDAKFGPGGPETSTNQVAA